MIIYFGCGGEGGEGRGESWGYITKSLHFFSVGDDMGADVGDPVQTDVSLEALISSAAFVVDVRDMAQNRNFCTLTFAHTR